MKAFVIAALAGLAAAAPAPAVSSHVVSHGHGTVVAHGTHGVHAAHPFGHAVQAAPLVAHPFGHAVHAAPLLAHPFAHAIHHPSVAVAPAHHAIHAVHAAPLIAHPAPYHPAVVAHPAAYHPAVIAHPAPVIAHAVPYHPAAYVEPEGVDEPYSYQYGVADDYSKAAFNAAETGDAAGVVTGSYSVALPDGRTQTVNYTSDNYNGYVADVTYEGVPVYPEAKPYVPAPAYHA